MKKNEEIWSEAEVMTADWETFLSEQLFQEYLSDTDSDYNLVSDQENE